MLLLGKRLSSSMCPEQDRRIHEDSEKEPVIPSPKDEEVSSDCLEEAMVLPVVVNSLFRPTQTGLYESLLPEHHFT